MSNIRDFKVKKPRGRPPADPEREALITAKARAFPDRPRKALVAELKEVLQALGKANLKDDTIERKISDARHSDPQPDDTLWDWDTLKENPLPDDSLPHVIKAWLHAHEKRGRALTIREAKWIARLYRFIDDFDLLFSQCQTLSFMEVMSEVSKAKIDWTPLNISLYEAITKQPISPELRHKLFYGSPDATISQRKWAKGLVDYVQNKLVKGENHDERPHKKQV
ncbi:MAG: hypothetical protein ABSB31_03565 [Dehalococcoidia bacterium]|jgi:hypothetical protein